MNFLLLSTPLFPRTWKKNSLLLALSFSCLLTQAQQGILQTKVSIQIKNQTIAQALEKIEEKTGCSFIYSPNLIDAQKKVSVNLQNARLETILQEILGDAVKRVETNGNRINLQPSSEKGNLNGQVHSSDGHPAGYVSISLAGRQVQADENGKFSFSNMEAGSYTVEAKYVGLLTQKQQVHIEANKTSTVNLNKTISHSGRDSLFSST